ncbi:MAG: pantetheine-phosphate adenylyltransferase [Flavobacteriaceae bacterium]|jgi:pantetheine-phosphate adenylyltransferase|nr:pantetheine-phosphate adenylyltransferase [Flavobacteriaceae bacterium]CAI8358306.1 MAG: Phosphopantetheine adenylyltransferase [uncultured Bacteroidetes bacterium]|tara:strand:- start:242 stop:697 length:456 start_codon:yes stop_codon:yes gene_type:complete
MRRFVFPGSFDPITIGHQEIIERAIPLCDELIIAVGENKEKKNMFSLKQRMDFIKETNKNNPKISVESYEGLTIDFCKKVNADALIRGLRNPADFEFEKSVAQMNRRLSGFETVFLLTSAGHAFISSSIVREIMLHKGDFSSLVPKAVKLK